MKWAIKPLASTRLMNRRLSTNLMEDPHNDLNTDEVSDASPGSVYEQQQKQLEHIRALRLQLRSKIRDFMEEETGIAYQLEDDLNRILAQELTPEQQQNVMAKIALLEQFPAQLNTEADQ